MKKHIKKPMRIDYYPKSEENFEEMKEVKVYSHSSPVCDKVRTTDYNEGINKFVAEDNIIKCRNCKVENVEVIEEKVLDDIEKLESMANLEELEEVKELEEFEEMLRD